MRLILETFYKLIEDYPTSANEGAATVSVCDKLGGEIRPAAPISDDEKWFKSMPFSYLNDELPLEKFSNHISKNRRQK